MVSNIHTNDLYLAARHDFNGGSNVPIANRVIIPYQGATELLSQPMIGNPSDVLRFQALNGTTSSATGINNGLSTFIVLTEKTDTNFVGTGANITSADQTTFTSTTNPSVIQSIRLCNYNLNIDIDASVSIFNSGGSRVGYLVFNLTVPKNSVIEILERPLYLAASETIRASSSYTGSLSVCISGKFKV